jgi:hypothetical protein
MQIELVITAVIAGFWTLLGALLIGVLLLRRARSLRHAATMTPPAISAPVRRPSDPPAAPVSQIASQPFGATRQVHPVDIRPEVALRILSGEDPTGARPAVSDSAATPSERPPATPQS